MMTLAIAEQRLDNGELSGRLEIFSGSATARPLVPERALAAGVLRQAAADLRRFRNAKDVVGREMHADALAWFDANDSDWPYSYLNVCAVLGLSPESVRDEMLEHAAANWYSHSRRVVSGLARSVKVSVANLIAGREAQSLASVRS